MATLEHVRRPEVLVFDVNQTLSDMSPLASRFEEVGAPGPLAQRWFAELLRDGFALTTAGAGASFADIGAQRLRELLEESGGVTDVDEAVVHVTRGLDQLAVHDDVVEGVRRLGEAGLRLVTMSNGAASVAEGLLGRAGIRDRFERLMSAESVGVWKPAPAAYAHAVGECGVVASEAMLVAVHPWDVDGASRAGLRTAWVDRDGRDYPGHFTGAEVQVASLVELAALLG